MSLIIFSAVAFISMQPVWTTDQNFYYFHRTNHPSILSTADEHATVAHLDLSESNLNNQRLQVRSAESDQAKPQPETTVPTNASPDTPAVLTAPAPTPQPVLPIPPQNVFHQLYGPAQVTSYFHNTLAGPLPLPFQHLPASTYENIVGQPRLHTFGNTPLLFQRTVPTHAPLPVVNVQPAPIPQPLFLHPSTISNAQGFFEVRQPAVTGYAYSIGSNDKIVATSSFTLGSSKHDPSFSRFKFLGQRPFENFENPYFSHLFQGKGIKQENVTPTAKTTPKPVVVTTKPTQKTQKSIPASAPTISTATDQTVLEKQKVSDVGNGETPDAPDQKISDLAEKTHPEVQEIASDKNIPDATEPKPSEVDVKAVSEVAEMKVPEVEEKVVSEPVVPEVDNEKVPSIEGLDVENEEVPEITAENVPVVDKNSVSEVEIEKVPEVGDLVSEVDENSVPQVAKRKLPDTVNETPTADVEQNLSDSDKPALTSVSSESIIPPGEVIVPNTGRVRGIPTVSNGDETRVTNAVEVVRGVVIPETQNKAANSVKGDEDTKLSIAEKSQVDVATVKNTTEHVGKSVADMVQGEDDQGKEGYEVEERSYNARPPNQNSFQSLSDSTTKIKTSLVFPKLFPSLLPTLNEISTIVPPTDAPTTQFISSSTVTTTTPEPNKIPSPTDRYGTVQSKYLPTPETRALKLLQAGRFRKVDPNKTVPKPSLIPEKQSTSDEPSTDSKVKPTKHPRVRVVIKTKVRDPRTKNAPEGLPKPT